MDLLRESPHLRFLQASQRLASQPWGKDKRHVLISCKTLPWYWATDWLIFRADLNTPTHFSDIHNETEDFTLDTEPALNSDAAKMLLTVFDPLLVAEQLTVKDAVSFQLFIFVS